MPTVQRIFGRVSTDQTPYHIGLGQDEVTEGFEVFDTHRRAGTELPTPYPNGQRRFENGTVL